jgi:hypothetical protein
MRSTVALFREMYQRLPPLFPPEVKKKMHHALVHLEQDQTVTLREIEDTMIIFGSEAWPWNQAYREFFVLNESKIGEHFFIPKLKDETAKRYEDFKHYGGTLRDLHSGRPAEFFSVAERQDIRAALINTQSELREYTDREVLGTEKARYLNRVEEFTKLIARVQGILGELKKVAEDEQDHSVLADQIRARIKSFEYSFCLLGPNLEYEAVESSLEFFAGRKHELNRLRGIHETVNFTIED